jgi:hypothetical protein
VLDVDLIDDHGFTVSDELRKRLLGEIKLADLTIETLPASPRRKRTNQKSQKPGRSGGFRAVSDHFWRE